LNDESGCYEWSPKALRVFEIENPQPGGDVAAIKAGNVSVTPLSCGFGPGTHEPAGREDASSIYSQTSVLVATAQQQ